VQTALGLVVPKRSYRYDFSKLFLVNFHTAVRCGHGPRAVDILAGMPRSFHDESNPGCVIEVFVHARNLSARLRRCCSAATCQPSHHPSILLKLDIYGYINRVQPASGREAGRNGEVMWLLGRLSVLRGGHYGRLRSFDYRCVVVDNRAVRKRLDFERPVANAIIRECLQLAVQAPTGANRQGWRWIVITDRDKRNAWVRFIAVAPGRIWRTASGTLRLLEPHKTVVCFRRPDILPRISRKRRCM
jgi:hypothetical protein